jgi:hypothetical protein
MNIHLITHWHVPGTVSEIAATFADLETLPRWWSAVFLKVQKIAAGDDRVFAMQTQPYALRWQTQILEITPVTISLRFSGDLEGESTWYFAQNGDVVDVVHDWNVQITNPLVRMFGFVLKQIFVLEYLSAMNQGERSLQRDIRQRTGSNPDLALIPSSSGPLLIGVLLMIGILWLVLVARHRRD